MNMNRNQNRNEFDRSDKHLTANEISRWLVEGPESSASRHLQSCGACRATLAEAQQPLTVFRTALVGWSEAQSGAQSLSARNLERPKENHWGIRLWLPVSSLALAALLLAGYAKVPGVLRRHSPDQTAATFAHPTPDSDAALLDQVDVEVSEAVPDSMAPLTDLVAWDSSNGSEAISAEKPGVHKKTSASAKPAPAAEIAN